MTFCLSSSATTSFFFVILLQFLSTFVYSSKHTLDFRSSQKMFLNFWSSKTQHNFCLSFLSARSIMSINMVLHFLLDMPWSLHLRQTGFIKVSKSHNNQSSELYTSINNRVLLFSLWKDIIHHAFNYNTKIISLSILKRPFMHCYTVALVLLPINLFPLYHIT